MIIPDSISLGIISSFAYDLLKQSVQVTFSSLKNLLQRSSLNQKEEEALNHIVSLLEQIPEELKKSQESIEA